MFVFKLIYRLKLYYLLVLSIFISYVSSCGPAVHNEVAERARVWFDALSADTDSADNILFSGIINENLSPLQTGVLFPDWGYGCLNSDNEAEVAHWTPFLETAITLFNTKYKKPYDEDAKIIISFIYGIAAHQVADESWHSIHMPDGFMNMIGKVEFNNTGDYHNILDIGGDFFMKTINNLDYIKVSLSL
ncbi:Phosphatidylinositol-glycan-specific phospholipase D [Smittium culicis]|uniref:Phosphatidylinositol-glycan-specific phospholipase D n=1 Tax=Smittium culicis TaxID=133412 RepID=A0A1R1YSM2_9FUNG|nr:Phosphatidylinositol-glycan-specific phospholipase D [Smittium culicis]